MGRSGVNKATARPRARTNVVRDVLQWSPRCHEHFLPWRAAVARPLQDSFIAEAGISEAALKQKDDPVISGPWVWILPEYFPIGFTNPVRVDEDRDGAFTPPGL